MENISYAIHNWYFENKRDLPWRETDDPYKIWISEIILQQTRVNQGMDYYFKFIQLYPNISSLANADLDEVLKCWQGLGYYSRARNLHKAAQKIVADYNGLFPDNYNDVLTLSGIGPYTAAAICSIAYNLPFAVVDGNVYRVLSRIFGIKTPINSTEGIKEFAILAQKFLDTSIPDVHNQSVMEFGALHCVPVNPDCEHCPVRSHCKALELGEVENLPVKLKKLTVKVRYFNYLFFKYGDKTFLYKRTGNDIWRNLYELPLIESDKNLSDEELTQNSIFQKLTSGIDSVKFINTSSVYKHILTHRIIYARFHLIEINNLSDELNNFLQADISQLDTFAVSRLTEMYFDKQFT